MLISDWSSDVCSSDLSRPFRSSLCANNGFLAAIPSEGDSLHQRCRRVPSCHPTRPRQRMARNPAPSLRGRVSTPRNREEHQRNRLPDRIAHAQARRERMRSEEHTSELKSLMRISYAVICLKNTTTENNIEPY